MLKKISLLLFSLPLLAFAGCAKDEGPKENAATPAASAAPTPAIKISYDQGFYGQEGQGNNTWHWMNAEGVIRLKNEKRDMKLKISGRAPVEHLPKLPDFKIQFNGAQLDQFTCPKEAFEKEYLIPVARQGSGEWSELRLSTNQSFVPKETDKNSTDPRRLGFSLHKLSWEPQ